jgi:hypothetical protein
MPQYNSRLASIEQRGDIPVLTARPSTKRAVLNNRPSYLSFGLAWLLGYGALAHGYDPGLSMPSVVPAVLLGGGLMTAVIITSVVTARAQRGVRGRDAVVGNLLGASWLVGFGALFLIITALSAALHEPQVHTLLWPTGAGLVVGLLYLAGGVAHRDVLQYTLGGWLAVMSSAALLERTCTGLWRWQEAAATSSPQHWSRVDAPAPPRPSAREITARH